MAAEQQTPARRGAVRDSMPVSHGELEPDTGDWTGGRLRRLVGGGTTGNERLTAATGIVLILLLAVIGVTILRLRSLISVHLFIGLVLIPPVALKMSSTGYRFMRYYTSNPIYRKRGTPPIALRLIAPIIVASTVAVFATGIALLFTAPASSGTLRTLHKASFILWVGFMAIHVVGHLGDLNKTFLSRRGGRVEYNDLAAGRAGRAIALIGALVAGVVLAILLIPHFGAWSHFEAFHHHRLR